MNRLGFSKLNKNAFHLSYITKNRDSIFHSLDKLSLRAKLEFFLCGNCLFEKELE